MPEANDRQPGTSAAPASVPRLTPHAIPPTSGEPAAAVQASDWDRRVDLLLPSLPRRVRASVVWLRVPSRRWFRVGAGFGLIAGSMLAILPVFGLWMLPLGLALLGEDYPPLKILLERTARWGERVWRRWRPR